MRLMTLKPRGTHYPGCTVLKKTFIRIKAYLSRVEELCFACGRSQRGSEMREPSRSGRHWKFEHKAGRMHTVLWSIWNTTSECTGWPSTLFQTSRWHWCVLHFSVRTFYLNATFPSISIGGLEQGAMSPCRAPFPPSRQQPPATPFQIRFYYPKNKQEVGRRHRLSQTGTARS